MCFKQSYFQNLKETKKLFFDHCSSTSTPDWQNVELWFSFKGCLLGVWVLDFTVRHYSRTLLFLLFLLYLWGPLPLSVLNNCYFCVSRLLDLIFLPNLLFSLYLWGPLPLPALKNCYSCCYRLLYSLFLLYLLFSLFLLYLWGPLLFSALKNCYSCCCRFLHLFIFAIFVIFVHT